MIYLGIPGAPGSFARGAMRGAAPSSRFALRQGVVSNLLNPKIDAMGVVWLLAYASATARGRNVLARRRVRHALDRLSGVVLIGLGARLALERR